MLDTTRFTLIVYALALFPAIAVGQTVSTQIVGLVTDPTGAVIPGATVAATRVETGDVRTTSTNATGNYIFPLLEPGTYEVRCSMDGFKTEVRRDLTLQLQQKLRVDFQMQIGQQVEVVEVTGATPLLGTEDATLGSVIEHKRVVDLPLNGRNFGHLAVLMPGVVLGVSRMGLDGQGAIGGLAPPGQLVGVSANGQRDVNQGVTMDGVVAADPQHGAALFSPSIEAIEEFKVQSAVYSAEYGMNSGAQVNVAVKSGTNELHGTLFEFLRNDQLDARGFFLPRDQEKNKLRKNQFGAVASGPIVKDKTFWLFNYEGRRERRATPASATVPTLEMRVGDFSEIVQPGNRWYKDPHNRQIGFPDNDDPFPNNIIPQSLINSVSNNLLTWQDFTPISQGGFMPFPTHDAQARAAGNTVNLLGTNDQSIDVDQYLARVDHRFGENDRIFGRYVIVESDWDTLPLQQITFQNSAFRAQNVAIGYTKIISPTIVNDFRFGLNRMVNVARALHTDSGFSQRDLGLDFRVVGDNNRVLEPFEEGLPTIGISGFQGMSAARVRDDRKQVLEFSDSVTISRGKHNFKFGGLFRPDNPSDGRGANAPRGRIDFTRDIDGVPDAFAAFMLGIPTSTGSAEGARWWFLRQKKGGMYFLDDWKATPKLTINYGVRWDIFGTATDADGRIRNLSFEDGDATIFGGVQTQGVRENLLGFHQSGTFVPMLLPNPQVTEKLYDINMTQIMPRLGIAYRFTDTMVLRIGAGHFYNAQQLNNFSILSITPPFSGSVRFENDRTTPTLTIDSPLAGSAVEGPTALVMLGNLQADKGHRSLYLNNDIWQWSAQIEKSLTPSLVTSIGYIGSAGSNIDMPMHNFNNPDPGPGGVQDRRPFPFYVDSRDPSKLLPLSTVRRLEPSVNSNYNALQLKAEQRYSRGLTYTASFNYQKAMTIGYGVNEGGGFGTRVTQDPRNREADYARSNIDQRFRFVFSHVWEVPWMRDAGGLKGALLGGWAINGIIQLTSGLPVTVFQTGDAHNTGSRSAPRPHVLPGQKVDRVMEGRNLERWFNTDAFIRSKYEGSPGSGLFIGPKGYGNAGAALFDAPAQKTWDFALFKEFRINEGHRVQFRWESFNFLNTPQFRPPNASVGSSSVGRITSTISANREMQFGLKYIF